MGDFEVRERRRDIIMGLLITVCIIGTVVVIVLFGTLPGVAPAEEQWMNKKIKMELATEYLINDQYLMYYGMPSDERFVLSHAYNACPVYYPTSVKEFRLFEHMLRLEEVTPMYIELTYLGKVEDRLLEETNLR